MGWIVTLAAPGNPKLQISLMSEDATAPVVPVASIEVDDVDAAYALAVERGAEIVHPLTDEPWGVRRFFVRDPDGHVVNVLEHLMVVVSRRSLRSLLDHAGLAVDGSRTWAYPQVT